MKIKNTLFRIMDIPSKLISKINVPATIVVIMLFITSANVHSQSGWFSQPLPVNGQVQDLKFFDANTGLIAMWQPTVLLRTTNGGYNWDSVLNIQVAWQFELIDSNIVYAIGSGVTIESNGILLKSTNRGEIWDSLRVANSWTVNGISFVNKDTGWVGGTAGGLPFLWRTTNAGVTWTVQSDDTGFGKVFFLKQKVNGEYIGWSMNYNSMWKTTNSGINWIQIQQSFGISDLFFSDENTGYVSAASIFKITTNGGLNWASYSTPTGNYIFYRNIGAIKIINKDTIYGDNGSRLFPDNTQRGIIWVSTNGGVNWGFQQPDTSLHNGLYNGIDFINKETGWSVGYNMVIRTNNGGGPIIMPTYIPNNGENAAGYELMQNYPNPFNSSTAIELSVPKDSYVSLKITDLTGKTVFRVLYEMPLRAGTHKFTINGFGKLNLASGVYFYTIDSRDMYSNKSRFTQTRKMLYIK